MIIDYFFLSILTQIVDRKSFDELSKYWMNTIETSLSDPSKDFILCFSNGCCRK